MAAFFLSSKSLPPSYHIHPKEKEDAAVAGRQDCPSFAVAAPFCARPAAEAEQTRREEMQMQMQMQMPMPLPPCFACPHGHGCRPAGARRHLPVDTIDDHTRVFSSSCIANLQQQPSLHAGRDWGVRVTRTTWSAEWSVARVTAVEAQQCAAAPVQQQQQEEEEQQPTRRSVDN
jgi:hypothetical protein